MFQMVPDAIHCEASSGLQAGAIGNLFVSPISWKLGVRCAIWELLVARISGRFHDDFGRMMSYEQFGKQKDAEGTHGAYMRSDLSTHSGGWKLRMVEFADLVCSSGPSVHCVHCVHPKWTCYNCRWPENTQWRLNAARARKRRKCSCQFRTFFRIDAKLFACPSAKRPAIGWPWMTMDDHGRPDQSTLHVLWVILWVVLCSS